MARNKINNLNNQITNELADERQKISDLIGWIVFIVVIALLSFVLIIKLAFPESSIPILGFRVFLVSDTRSMEPMYHHNDLLIAQGSDFQSLQIDDVVIFESHTSQESVIIAHKIMDVVRDDDTGTIVGFVTGGVNENVGVDLRLLTENGADNTNRFMGLVTYHNAGLGHVVRFVLSPIGIILIIINISLLIMATLYNRHVKVEDDYFINLERQLLSKHEEVAVEKAVLKQIQEENNEELRTQLEQINFKEQQLQQFSKELRNSYHQIEQAKKALKEQEKKIQEVVIELKLREEHVQKIREQIELRKSK